MVAVDGKTVRGARTGDATAPHLLACLDHGTGVVLAQVAVDGKTNEIIMFTALLGQAGDLREAGRRQAVRAHQAATAPHHRPGYVA